jgi:hypothetical protein
VASNRPVASSSRDAGSSRPHAIRPLTRERGLRLVTGDVGASPVRVVRLNHPPDLSSEAACVLARMIQRALLDARQDAG